MNPVMKQITQEMDRTFGAYLDACVHCGNCAEACHFYEMTGDSKYVPALKFEPVLRTYQREMSPLAGLKRALGLAPPEVSDAEVEDWRELLYDSCTMCGRCTLVCPMDIDIAYVVSVCRRAMMDNDMAPPELKAVAERSRNEGSPLGVTPNLLKERIDWVADEHDVDIPLDQDKADVLLTLSSIEVMKYPQDVAAMAEVMNHSGVSWTISSKGYEATNFGYLAGDREIAKTMVTRVVEAAEAVGAKTVIVPECGHAYGVMRWNAANIMGRELPFTVLHISEFLEQLRQDGKLRLKPMQKKVTFHDPCQIVRRGGATEAPRNVLSAFATDFVEMQPSGNQNWCCGGGGGVATLTSAKELQYKVFEIKREQVAKTGAEAMVSSCSNCRLIFDEDIEHAGWDKENLSLVELVAEHLQD
jgi:Fe-S oxidoreductase